MEKVKIANITIKKKGTTKAGNPWTLKIITLEDGSQGNSFDEFTIREECEIEIIPNENPNYLPNFEKIKESKKQITTNVAFEQKKCALECTIQMVIHSRVEDKNITECFNKFLKLLS